MSFFLYLAVCSLVTYAVRVLPFILVKKKITNRFVLSFLHYIPNAILAVMTIPAIFSATGNTISAVAGLLGGLILAYLDQGLLVVAIGASGTVFVVELLLSIL